LGGCAAGAFPPPPGTGGRAKRRARSLASWACRKVDAKREEKEEEKGSKNKQTRMSLLFTARQTLNANPCCCKKKKRETTSVSSPPIHTGSCSRHARSCADLGVGVYRGHARHSHVAAAAAVGHLAAEAPATARVWPAAVVAEPPPEAPHVALRFVVVVDLKGRGGAIQVKTRSCSSQPLPTSAMDDFEIFIHPQ